MRQFRIGLVSVCVVLLCGFATGCKKACDDLADVCAKCSGDYKTGCDLQYELCDVFKGKAGGDCCETALDEWKETCN